MKTTAKSRMTYLASSVFYIITASLSIAVAFLLQRTADSALTGEVSQLINALLLLIVVWPFRFLAPYIAARLRLGYVREMLLIAKESRLHFLFSRRSKTPAKDDSKELSFFTADADILDTSYFSHKARIPLFVAEFSLALIALLWINWQLTLAAIAVTMLPLLSSGLFSKGLAKRQKAYSDAAADYVDMVGECIEGKKEIVAYDKHHVFMRRHRDENHRIENARLRSNIFQVLAGVTSDGLGFLVQAVILGLGSYFVITGDLTFGYMIAVIQLMNNLFRPVSSMVEAINGIRAAKPIVEKAKETAEPEHAKTRITDFTDAIEIKGLGLKYDENEYVLKDLDLTFKKGGKYAILAPSGYGKTSIARALAMEFADFDGSITMDGKDIRALDTHDYNKILRYVRQDPFLFSDTALNNLAFFDGTPDPGMLSKVLRLTRVDEFLPDADALERQVSNTSGLSGGQKQRIVLARALLHNPKVLVLDEITSGVDLETACNILSDIFQDKDLTCVSITHENDERFLGQFDEIYRLAV
ncbi:MAG: ABC transporter ATP-binding protein/permease [Defluviitaleaceae bacterium]|nr:ABC transporter ATP-binding protein/permease [Defluviitaleaceae bacterium]MCL2238954.1 ABC transporter ATP-binding protein/permease [Defluviitaleaceae bacterium]MCL2240603.1 ABC transporter ATP-binding protein/permease [Defluviitaleaceae bacterium]